MQKYELTVILDGKASSTKKKSVAELIAKVVAISRGKVGKLDDWGTKDLAYPIAKSTSGVYLHFPLELETDAVKGLLAKLRANEDIVRYLMVKANK
ncbi:MAG: 30S ribosomal protein S6 [Patescibacteria group bacterium]